jgi:hypothetical protein
MVTSDPSVQSISSDKQKRIGLRLLCFAFVQLSHRVQVCEVVQEVDESYGIRHPAQLVLDDESGQELLG